MSCLVGLITVYKFFCLVEPAKRKFATLGNPCFTVTPYCTNQKISNAVMNLSQIKIK